MGFGSDGVEWVEESQGLSLRNEASASAPAALPEGNGEVLGHVAAVSVVVAAAAASAVSVLAPSPAGHAASSPAVAAVARAVADAPGVAAPDVWVVAGEVSGDSAVVALIVYDAVAHHAYNAVVVLAVCDVALAVAVVPADHGAVAAALVHCCC
jgi:hypothetical protein